MHLKEKKTSRDYRADKFLVTFFTLKDPERLSGRFFFYAERERGDGVRRKIHYTYPPYKRTFFPIVSSCHQKSFASFLQTKHWTFLFITPDKPNSFNFHLF